MNASAFERLEYYTPDRRVLGPPQALEVKAP
jgi:hypothetical protein